MLRTVEYTFNTTNSVVWPIYSSSTVTRGSLINIYTGVTNTDNYAGPFKTALARPFEQSTAIPGMFPWVYRWSDTIDWVFLADGAAAANTRRVILYEYDRSSSLFNWKGFVTLTYPTATAHTIRGFRVTVDTYTAGTASVAGTAVSGVTTAWSASRLAVGARIGFGSTNPNAITTWFVISAIGSNTSITLSTNAGTISSGPYVIEEIRTITANTNATATNGGLYVAKGLNYGDFMIAGTTIPAAVSTDNIKAVYFLGDAQPTQTNTTTCGLGLEDRESWTAHTAYVIEGTSNPRILKYNLRASLSSFASGKSPSAYLFSTATQTVTGILTQVNNGRVTTLQHGPGKGVNSLYFVTGTRVYRAALSGITTASTSWISDAMVEIPAGSASSFPATGVFNNVEPSSMLDRLVIHSTGAAGVRSYITRYNSVAEEFDEIFMIDTKQQDQSLANSNLPPIPSIGAANFSTWSEAGLAYMTRIGTTAAVNQLYAIPLGADWNYAATTGQRLITPEMLTPNVSSYNRVYVNNIRHVGDPNYGVTPDAYRVYYRTRGISDNTGDWTLVDDGGGLDGVGPAASIQFMFEFKTISAFCYPARITGVVVTYNDLTTDSRYQPSAGNSSLTSKRFAWRFATAFGSTVPTLRVRLYDAVSGGLLVDDNTASPTGTFEKSTNDGGTWGSYDTTDLTNNTTYIRYTPLSLGENIKVRALLTLN